MTGTADQKRLLNVQNLIWIFTALFSAGVSWATMSGDIKDNGKEILRLSKQISQDRMFLERLEQETEADRLKLVRSLSDMQADIRYMRESITRIDKRTETQAVRRE
ncbi:hypothetical protein [Pseudovibrio brasiliensis]|uniref:Uncharacterized protein n=1 Tax=Pseudovibrio brasiliensis TaxID=1898042 RepID=A0ABX8AWZ6_9HYPH|nr:hypothetical protein [Pseudovibrio brasiliensis]QUS59187.1 hypothetical protein KGB56_26950 [Pseudovibrio brasiliensis]